jgi:hypothetical protein
VPPLAENCSEIMSSAMLDSVHVFRSRAQSVGLSQAVISSLEAGAVDTLSKLAYVSTNQPGCPDDSDFVKTITGLAGYDMSGNPIPAGVLSCLRRLWFEAHAVSLAEIKSRIERADDAPLKKLPLPEREARRKAQQAVLVGLKIEKQLEPSHALVDLLFTMREEEVLRYVEPAQCTCRESELLGVKSDSFLKLDQSGKLQKVQKDQQIEADISTEFRMKLALQRRSLALDQLQLMAYEKSEAYHDYLFSLLLQQPPEGFSPVTMKQLLTADRQAWLFAAGECREGISVRPSGVKPLEIAFEKALNDPMVRATLQPLPKTRGGSFQTDSQTTRPRPAPYFERRSQSYPKGDSKGYGKRSFTRSDSKGSGKGKFRGSGRVPQALKGGKAVTSSGQYICFGYNLQGCPDATPGKSCQKGRHVCCKCESSEHTFQTCPNKGK